MNIVRFACNATIETNDAHKLTRVAVWTIPNQGGKRPQLNGKDASCLYECPCRRRAKRKEQRVVFGEDTPFHPDNFGTLVTCVPIANERKP